jgi:hypothetical protein
MKSYWLFALLVVLKTNFVFGQGGKAILVRAGEDIAKAYSPNGFYRFSQFAKATLFRKTGKSDTDQLLNYNIFSGAMQFINEKGDTLDLINPSLFDSIAIDGNIFYYEDGFMELVASSQPFRLFKKTRIKLIPERKGAYGSSNSTGASDKISSYTFGNSVYNISVTEDMTVKESIDWFWMDEKGKLWKANKDNLFLLLPADKQESVKAWLKQNKTSFGKEPDLRRLMQNL